jgi:Glucokinase
MSSLPPLLSAETAATLQSWPGHKLNLLLAVDVGGTHVRISLSRPKRTQDLTIDKLECRSHLDLLELLRRLARELCPDDSSSGGKSSGVKQVNVVAACVAAAGPIKEAGTRVVITNYSDAKTFADGAGVSVDDLPAEIFPRLQTSFVNDLEGLCEGVIALAEDGKIFDIFRQMWDGDDSEDAKLPVQECHRDGSRNPSTDSGLFPVNCAFAPAPPPCLALLLD